MLRKLLSLLSDSATYGASGLIGQLLSFLLLGVYSNYLSVPEYGVIGMLAIVTLLFGPLANLGMTNAIFRRYSMTKDPETRAAVLSTGLVSVLACSGMLLLVTLAAAEPIARVVVGDPDSTNLVRITLFSAAIGTIATVPRVVLRAARRVRIVALLNIAQILLTAGPTLWFVVVREEGLRGFVLGTLVGDVLSAALAFAAARGFFHLTFALPTWRGMLSYGLPFVPHHVQAVALALFGQYMVREMLGLGDAGLYNMATKFAMPVAFVVTAVQNSWTAYKFQIHAEDEDPKSFFRSTFTYYVAGLSYLWVGVCFWGPEMVRLITAENFHSAAGLVWATSLIPVAQGVYFMSGTGIELTNDTRAFPLVSLAGLITVVGGAFAFVQSWGALGAALATVLGWVVMGVLTYYFSQRRFAIEYDWATVCCLGALGILCAVISWAVQPMPLAARLICALAVSLVYPLAAFLLLLRSRQERHRMHILLAKVGWAGSHR
jgi:O-antigen/teichoic acid export membrane protein